MSLWERLKARFSRGDQGGQSNDSPKAPAVQPKAQAKPSPVAHARQQDADSSESFAHTLRRAGRPDGPDADQAILILRSARGTEREAEALKAIADALTENPLPEPLRIAYADLLAARGEEGAALLALSGVTSTEGLLLAADLYAALGQLPRALCTVERVLGREIDAPGARERHRRWLAALGLSEKKTGHLDEATIVAANPKAGPFRLVREVARGGAGAVYEAMDELLGRRVAFKVYHGRSADRAVLLRETHIAARLWGPGVVRIFDASPDEGWIALEWIGRGSIRDRLRAGDTQTLLPMMAWAKPLARALARVHAAGIVHGDLKPANVLLRQPDEPVLGDFGIAQGVGDAAEAGSAGYVSPERLAGRVSHPKDDVYGFGRILEDVLHVLAEKRAQISGGEERKMRALAMRCIGPDEGRPGDGGELLRTLLEQ